MAKLGLKAVKSSYKANKHSAGDTTIKWPQRMKLTLHNSFPCHIRYTLCIMLQ